MTKVPDTTATFGFRFRGYDGTESAAPWISDENQNVNFILSGGNTIPTRLRFSIDNPTPLARTKDFNLQFRLNGGSWLNSNPTYFEQVISHPDLSEELATTQQLTPGTGSFFSGRVALDFEAFSDILPNNILALSHTEVEYVFNIVTSALNDGDLMEFRLSSVIIDLVYPGIKFIEPSTEEKIFSNNVFTDALSNAKTYDITGDIDPKDRVLHRDLEKRCDCPYDNASLEYVNQVQTITPGDRAGGTMDLTFTLNNGDSFSLIGVDFSETATNLQRLIDIELHALGYLAGDIAVTGGPFGAAGANTVIYYRGELVHSVNHPLITIDTIALSGGTTDPVVSQTTSSIPSRFWFASLKAMGVIEGTDPAFGAAPAGQYTVNTRDELENYPSNETIKRLIKEATVQEGQDWEAELYPLLNL